MSLSEGFLHFVGSERLRRLGFYFFRKGGRLVLNTFLPWFFKNQVVLSPQGIPEPLTFNSFKDVTLRQDIGKLLWVMNDQNIFTQKKYVDLYNMAQYPALTKAFFPVRMSDFENINMNRIWQYSYFNETLMDLPVKERFEKYRHSDALFGDLMVNTQGIYQAKKVKDEETVKFVKNRFSKVLEANRKVIDKSGRYVSNPDIIDALIQDNNLFFVHYPALEEVEKPENKKTKQYVNRITSINGESFDAYLEIPFAIFAEVTDYYQFQGKTKQRDFVCLGAVFNGGEQVYHPFDQEEDMVIRGKWQMAKCHIACADNNHFTTRIHLGVLHYASAVFTTAFSNIAKQDKKLNWMKDEFIDVFTPGLLMTNFSANMTLVDTKDPLVQKLFYLKTEQSGAMITKTNKQLDMLTFCPEVLGKDSYQSDSVKISGNLYEKYEAYIDYLFEKHKSSWKGREQYIGSLIYAHSKADKGWNGLSLDITKDDSEKSLKKLMTNLVYIWCVFHGQTFSNVSVFNNFYFAPTTMRKPLSAFPNTPLDKNQKQEWISPVQNAQDNISLIKTVTYRRNVNSIISNWNELLIDHNIWKAIKHSRREERGIEDPQDKRFNFTDHWDPVTMATFKLNSQRVNDGLFNLHWLQAHELPHALNI